MSREAPVSMALVRNTVRYYAEKRRWRALVRATWWTVARRHGSELCDECGRPYPFRWWSPQPLWTELRGRYGGLSCPRCFDRKARVAGIRLHWTPMVVERDGVATTNWWFDETRDALLMGEPDPGYHDGEKVHQPQRTWDAIKPLIAPNEASPYPNENRAASSVAKWPGGVGV